MSTRIARELEWGHRVTCAFLADGTGKGVPSATRDRESRAVLASLGVPPEHQLFIGSLERIPDRELVLHLDRAWRALVRVADAEPITRIYTLAYEGGHPDHDAAYVLAVLLARRQGLLRRAWQVPFYHGWGTPGQLFRVHQALPTATRHLVRRVPLLLAARHVTICWRYPSQWRTWVGLFPEYCLQRGLRRREVLAAIDPPRVRQRPHPGPVLYERMRGLPYETFAAAVNEFLKSQAIEPSSLGDHGVPDH